MRNRFPTLIPAALLALLLVVPAVSLAKGPVAEVENAGSALIFHPLIEAVDYRLTVAGPCRYEIEIVGRQGPLVFKLDQETFDGAYTYSLAATPLVDPEVMEVMRKARETGDTTAVRQLCHLGKLPDVEKQTQTGSFVVSEGKIVFDATPERRQRGDDRDR